MAECTSEVTSSRETMTEEDNGIDLATAMRSSSWLRRDSIPTSSTGGSSSTSRNWSLTRRHPPGPVLVLGLNVLRHDLRHEGGDVTAETSDFADEFGGHERPLGAGGDEDRLDPGEVVVHLGHLHFGLEVRDGPQPPHDGRGTHVAGDVDQQRRHRDDPHGREVRHHLLQHRLALFQVEERRALLGIAQRGDDHFVEETARPFHDLEVPVVKGVEGPGEKPDLHEPSPLR